MFPSFIFKPPVSGLQSYSYSRLKNLQPYLTDDKTSRLMVKRFSTVRNTQRGSQSFREKRRGRKEIEVTRRREGVKRRETDLASIQSAKCVLHSLEHPERFTELHREEKREEGDRGDQEKKGDQKERDTSSQ